MLLAIRTEQSINSDGHRGQRNGHSTHGHSIVPLVPCINCQDIYRLLVTSLRASSVHFQQLSFDSVTVGLWGLSKAHAAAEPNALPGQVVLPAER